VLSLQLLKHLEQLIKEEAERHWKPPEGEDFDRLGSANQLFSEDQGEPDPLREAHQQGQHSGPAHWAFKVGQAQAVRPGSAVISWCGCWDGAQAQACVSCRSIRVGTLSLVLTVSSGQGAVLFMCMTSFHNMHLYSMCEYQAQSWPLARTHETMRA